MAALLVSAITPILGLAIMGSGGQAPAAAPPAPLPPAEQATLEPESASDEEASKRRNLVRDQQRQTDLLLTLEEEQDKGNVTLSKKTLLGN